MYKMDSFKNIRWLIKEDNKEKNGHNRTFHINQADFKRMDLKDIKAQTKELRILNKNLISKRIIEFGSPRKSLCGKIKGNKLKASVCSEVKKYIRSGSKYVDKRSKVYSFRKKFSRFKESKNFSDLKNMTNADLPLVKARKPIKPQSSESSTTSISEQDSEEIEKKKKQNELFKKLENRRAGILLPFNIPEKALEEGNQSSPNPSTPKKARRRSNLNTSRRHTGRRSQFTKTRRGYLTRIGEYLKTSQSGKSIRAISLEKKPRNPRMLLKDDSMQNNSIRISNDLSYISKIFSIMKTDHGEASLTSRVRGSRLGRIKKRYRINKQRVFSS